MTLEDLHLLPRLHKLIDGLTEIAERRGIHTAFGHDAGLRSTEKQWRLFKQGRKRNAKGFWIPTDPVHRVGIVTNALPRQSPHCAHVDHDGSVGAAACDVWIVHNERPVLKESDLGYDMYDMLGALGEELGLTWGGRFTTLHDVDHFELPDFRELGVPDA